MGEKFDSRMESEQKKIVNNPGAWLKNDRAYIIWVTVGFDSFLLVRTYDILISTALKYSIQEENDSILKL